MNNAILVYEDIAGSTKYYCFVGYVGQQMFVIVVKQTVVSSVNKYEYYTESVESNESVDTIWAGRTSLLFTNQLKVAFALNYFRRGGATGAGGGSSTWGGITGTITSQADLVSYIAVQIANIVASSPAALDTLNELAAALGNDANFATTINNSLAARELLTNKATDFAVLNNTRYPSVLAVDNQIAPLRTSVVNAATWAGRYNQNYILSGIQTSFPAIDLTNAVAGATVFAVVNSASEPNFLDNNYERVGFVHTASVNYYVQMVYNAGTGKVMVSSILPTTITAPSGLSMTGSRLLDNYPSATPEYTVGDALTLTATNFNAQRWNRATNVSGAGKTEVSTANPYTLQAADLFIGADALNTSGGFQNRTNWATNYRKVRQLVAVGTQADWHSTITDLYTTVSRSVQNNSNGFTGEYIRLTTTVAGMSYCNLGAAGNANARLKANTDYLINLRARTSQLAFLELWHDYPGWNFPSSWKRNQLRSNASCRIGWVDNTTQGHVLNAGVVDMWFIVRTSATNNVGMAFQYNSNAVGQTMELQVGSVSEILP